MKPINLSIISIISLLTLSCSAKDVTHQEDIVIECNYSKQSVLWNEIAPNGILPEDILAFSEFKMDNLLAESIFNENKNQIYFEIIRNEKNANYMTSDNCDSFLEIPLLVFLKTKDDGSFNEKIEVLGQELNGNLIVNHLFNLNELSGSFSPAIPQNSKIHSLSLVMEISPEGGFGKILVHIEEKAIDGSLTETSEEYWSWSWEHKNIRL